ncbi:hypothetical protein THAOC_16893, partial [Thalassiosira oceanica]
VQDQPPAGTHPASYSIRFYSIRFFGGGVEVLGTHTL